MTLGLLAFILTTIGAWVGMHYYTFLNLSAAGVGRVVLVPLLWCLALAFPVTRLLTLRWRNPVLRFIYRVGVTWMGLLFILSFWFLVASLLRRGLNLTGWAPASDPGPWILGTGSLVAAMGAWGLYHALSGPRDVHFEVDRSDRYGLGRSLKIVQISDVHLGLILGIPYLGRLVERINALQPDLVFITGDFFDPEFDADAEAAKLLKTVTAREGVFAVSGNHEFYAGIGRFQAMMEGAGVPVLDNEIQSTPSGVQIIGIQDQTANRFPALEMSSDLPKALLSLDPGRPSLLLAHQPKELEPAADKRVDLVFSGHTHNGQVFPFRAIVRLAYKYLSGRYRLGPDTELIVNTGTGFWGPPLRLGSDSQIVIVDFRC